MFILENKSDKELAIEFAKVYVASWNQSTKTNPIQIALIPELLKTTYEAVKNMK